MIEYTDKLIDEWADQLVECSDCGETDDWIAAFSEVHPPEIVEKVKTLARQKWRAEKDKNGNKHH